MTIDKFLSMLKDVRRNGTGWIGLCPGHEDHNPSLSARQEDGKILLHCLAGCRTNEVLNAMGLTMSDLFEDSPRVERRITATYPYEDETHTLLFEVVRYDPKGFAARRPDGKGGHLWNLHGTRRVLYNLPDVIKAKTVFICEGEKDCETARRLGIVATCNAGGCGKWRKEYSEFLKGKHLIVIADADDPGLKHADQVAATLYGGAASLKLLEFPDAKDLTAWFEDELHTLDELTRLINSVPEWKPANASSSVAIADRPPSHASWPEPLAAEAYYGLAGKIVKALEPDSEVDPAALLVQTLVSFGNMVGRRPYFRVGADAHRMNLFAVLVGVTSKARKGSSLSLVRYLFEQVDQSWVNGRVASGLSSGEGLIWSVRDAVKHEEKDEDTGQVKVVVDDPGVEDKRLIVIETEFASPLHIVERPGNTLSPVIRQAWDGLTLQILTKNNAARATEAHISMVGHVTQEEVVRYLTLTEHASGFANRFLWVCARRSKCIAEPGDPANAEMEHLVDDLALMAGFAEKVGRMKRDAKSTEVWRAVYPSLSEGQTGLMGLTISRAEAQVTRLSCIYALMDGSDVVRRPHMNAALAVWGYCEDSARFIFGDRLGDPVADEILNALKNHPGGVGRTDLHALFGRHKKGDQIDRALSLLAQRGLASFRVETTDGRSREVWSAVIRVAN